MNVEVLRTPNDEDWERCKMLALNTVSKTFSGEVTEEWRRKILRSGHSPIRTLMFTVRMEVPYYVSVHFSRHKYGVEHYVTSQRNDRQSEYDREKAPQDAPVVHIMDINAQELMFMARRRLCGMADPTTRQVMEEIVNQITWLAPEFDEVLVPMCEYLHGCNEFKGCGRWQDDTDD